MPEKIKELLKKKVKSNVDVEVRVLELLEREHHLAFTSQEMAEKLGLDYPCVKACLSNLKAAGKVNHIRPFWFVNKRK